MTVSLKQGPPQFTSGDMSFQTIAHNLKTYSLTITHLSPKKPVSSLKITFYLLSF